MRLQLLLLNLILITHWQLGKVWIWIVIGALMLQSTVTVLTEKKEK